MVVQGAVHSPFSHLTCDVVLIFAVTNLVALQVNRVDNADLLHQLLLSGQDLQGLSVLPLFLYKSHAHMVLLLHRR